DFTAIDPYFYADAAVSRMCFRCAVVDIGTQRMQRHRTFAVAFRTCDFRTAEATANSGFDSFRASAHCPLNRLFKRTTERDAAFQLLSDAFCYERSVQISLFDFGDIDVHFLAVRD